MSQRIPLLALILTLGAALATPALPSQAENDLELGISQAQEGDFETAVVTLDGVVRRLAREGAPPKTVARAYLYLSIAYFGLYQTEQAKAKFLEALQADPEMEITASDFPPRIYRFLDQVRTEARAQPAAEEMPEPPPARPTPEPASPSEEPEKGGSKMPLVLLGVGGAAAAGVALAAGGSGETGSGGDSPATQRVTQTFPFTLAAGTQDAVLLGPVHVGNGPLVVTLSFSGDFIILACVGTATACSPMGGRPLSGTFEIPSDYPAGPIQASVYFNHNYAQPPGDATGTVGFEYNSP